MKIHLRWTHTGLRVAVIVIGLVLIALTQGEAVRFAYQGY
jgi:hypothetical protein